MYALHKTINFYPRMIKIHLSLDSKVPCDLDIPLLSTIITYTDILYSSAYSSPSTKMPLICLWKSHTVSKAKDHFRNMIMLQKSNFP